MEATRNLVLTATRRAAMRLGFDLVHRDCYSPIPDLPRLPNDLWSAPSALTGISWNEAQQRHWFERDLARYLPEFDRAVDEGQMSAYFAIENSSYGHLDAAVLFATVRALCPRRIIEIGSGFSTLVTAAAVCANAAEGRSGEFVSVDPSPPSVVRHGIEGLTQLRRARGESLDLEAFDTLERDDVLFIDSTHVSRIGGEVNYLLLDVLPRLRPGVVVHVHDIYLPWEYPAAFIRERGYYWTEQYLVQALLCGTEDFEILLGTHWLGREHPDLVALHLPRVARMEDGGALWLRRAGVEQRNGSRSG